MSGLVRTSPLPGVIAAIELNGGIVPFRETAAMDQPGGTRVAFASGFSKVAVTIAAPDDAIAIRTQFPGSFLIAVHTTGITPEEARVLAEHADIVTSCASQAIREVAGEKALLQAGSSIPVFAMTQQAKDLILRKVAGTEGQFLVTGAKLPFGADSGPKPLV
jgi:putative methanogenesis marker protein 8